MSFIVFLLTIVANPLIKLSDCHASPTGITLDLVHRDHIIASQLSRAERLRQMVYRDMQRLVSSARRQTLEVGKASALTKIVSGSDYGIGEYLVKLKVGTPPQELLMVADSGSDLNMLKCNYKGKDNFSEGPVFQADKSSSFTGVSCALDFCTTNLTYMANQKKKNCDGRTCAYSDYGYASGLSTSGIFAYESFTFTQTNKKETVLKKMLIGCSSSANNLGTIKGTHGILGLGNFPLSFPALASQMFGVKFSMCLVDHLSSLSTSSGNFIFGSVPKKLLPATMQYTTLDTSSFASDRLYGLSITGVYINGMKMNISSVAWDNMNLNGGTIVDTGTSITLLNKLSYEPITKALNSPLSRFMKPVSDQTKVFQHCYNSKEYNESMVPKMEIEFARGVRLQPPPKSYLIDVSSTTKCLGFQLAPRVGYSTIGNILMQEHFLMFDVDNHKFGFGKSLCKT